MSSASEVTAGERLHPSVLAIWPSQQIFGLIALAVFGGGGSFSIGIGVLLSAGLALTLLGSLVRWYRFTWTVLEGTLVIEQGLIQRRRRVIPADRVQSVDLIRPLRQRLFGVVQVRVEVIGGGETEGVLDAVSPAAATAIQHALVGARVREEQQPASADKTGPADPADPAGPAGPAGPGHRGYPSSGPAPGATYPPAVQGRPPVEVGRGQITAPPRQLARVRPGQLVLAGLTGGRVGVAALLFGGIQQILGDRFDEALDLVPADLGILLGLILAAAALVAVFALSIVATVVSYWNFTLSRDSRELRLSRGLLTQRLETIPLRRIQAIRIEQNLLRRPFGLAAVKADLAGRAGGGDPGTGLLLPIGTLTQAKSMVADLLGSQTAVEFELSAAAPRARRRYLVRGLIATLLGLTAGVVVVVAGGPLWVGVALPLVSAVAGVPLWLATYRAYGYGEADGVVVAQDGVFVRRRVHIPVARIQQMSVQSSVFQRRLGLADVHLGIAASGGFGNPVMYEIDQAEAHALTASAVHRAVAASTRT